MNYSTPKALFAALITIGLLWGLMKIENMQFHQLMNALPWLNVRDVANYTGKAESYISLLKSTSERIASGEKVWKKIGQKGQKLYCAAVIAAARKKIEAKRLEIDEWEKDVDNLFQK